MKFSFQPNDFVSHHLLDDRNRGEAKVREEKKWISFTSAVDVYRSDKERYLTQAHQVGKLHEAKNILKKMEVDPASTDPKGFLEDFPAWPERRYTGDYDRIPLMQMKHHQSDFQHVGAAPHKMLNLDLAISQMNHSLKLVKESSVKSLFKKKTDSGSSKEWIYEVPHNERQLGADRPAFAISWMVAHEFNKRSDRDHIYVHTRIEQDLQNPSVWNYILLYPEDNAERHIWREVFLGIPRPQGSLLPPPFVADIPKPPPYAAASKTSLDKMKQLIETKNMLRLHGADDETLAAVTNQIAKLAIGTMDQSQQASRSRTKASDQNFV